MPVMPKSRTIPDLLDEMADRFPHREALVGRGRRCTYTVLRDEVRIFAKGLHALGVNPGDKVAVLMGNRPEWIIADLAICSLGAVMIRREHLGHQSRTPDISFATRMHPCLSPVIVFSNTIISRCWPN